MIERAEHAYKKGLIQNTSLNTDLSTEDVAAACVYSGRMRLPPPLPSGLDERSAACLLLYLFLPHGARRKQLVASHQKLLNDVNEDRSCQNRHKI